MIEIEKIFLSRFPRFMHYAPAFVREPLLRFMKALFHEQQYNAIYAKNHYLSGLEFVESMVEHLGITYTLKPKELKNIPSTGRLIVVANHITGGSDAFALYELIANAREDKRVKLMVNGMFMSVTQASEIIIPVDNITGAITKKSLKAIDAALQNEEAIIIFPAGIVSRWRFGGIRDFAWQPSFLRFARKNAAPILPIKIEARNSKLFYILSHFAAAFKCYDAST